MRFTVFACAFLVVVAGSALFVGVALHLSKTWEPDVYVGVYAGSTNVEELVNLADEVKSYTNLFVVGSFQVVEELPKLNQVCQRLAENGLNFLIFSHPNETVPFAQWVRDAQRNWGAQFLGLYAYDEVGGHQIDRTRWMAIHAADNYTDAAEKYAVAVHDWLDQLRNYSGADLPMYASDYVLYEYDYRAGYDAVFAQFGWNFSRPLHVALCRGAATMNGKPWGAIITWTFDTPPYLESGQRVYEDMVYAYQSGAKYILVFDFDENTTRGILQQEHLDALKRFWQYAEEHPRASSPPENRVAYVLPSGYGYGFRGPADKIWGLWEADGLSGKVWGDVVRLSEQYVSGLDIIYEDNLQPNASPYSQLVFWNGTS